MSSSLHSSSLLQIAVLGFIILLFLASNPILSESYHISSSDAISHHQTQSTQQSLAKISISDTSHQASSLLPAFKVFFPPDTQQFLIETTIPFIRQHILQEGSLPDQVVTTGIPVLGDVDISLSHMQLTDISNLHDRATLHTLESNRYWGIQLGSEQTQWMYVNVEGHFHTRQRNWPHLSTDGTFKANVGMQMILGLDLEPDLGEECLLKVKPVDSSIEVHTFDLDLHGGQAWFLDIFLKILKPRLIKSLESVMNHIVPDIIVSLLQKSLNELQFRFPFGESDWNVLVDFALKQFNIDSGSVAIFGGSGEFEKDSVIRYPSNPEFVPPLAYNSSVAHGRKLQIALDEYSLESLGFVLHKGGILHEVYLLPDITTDNMSSINELLPKKFPHCPMQVSVSSSEVPTVKISPGGLIHIIAPCDAIYQVIYQDEKSRGDSDPEIISVFTIGMNLVVNISSTVTPDATRVYGVVNFLGDETTYTVKSSEIGEIHNLQYLSIGTDIMIQQVIGTVINPRAKEGFPLPSLPNLRLSNAEMVKDFSGYVVVNADVSASREKR